MDTRQNGTSWQEKEEFEKTHVNCLVARVLQYWTSKGNKFYSIQNRFFRGKLGARIILMEAENVQSLVLDVVNLPESDSGTQLPPKNLFWVL
jgi:hypothetical protein